MNSTRFRSAHGMNPLREPAVPPWVRPAVPGEVLDDERERRCASKRCGAVFRRQEGTSAQAWANRNRCCA